MKQILLKEQVQNLGNSLSAMVMPNIGAFVAWGLMTALFIPSGWLPNEALASLTEPLLKYLLPLLLAYTGGKNVWSVRGAVIACIACFGVIQGASVPMFLGAMIYGPFSAWLLKQLDRVLEGKIREEFKMLTDNFSLGILGLLLAIGGFFLVSPCITLITRGLTAGANTIYRLGILPLLSVFIEPAKVLFLNNVINHGIFSPVGIQQASEAGKSIMFFLEPNPGPGFGILLAYSLFGRGAEKQTAPGAALIQFLGGIHEIYFPYVLMKPVLIVAAIAGNAAGLVLATVTRIGLVASPAPGSVLAILAMAPREDFLWVLCCILLSAAVSFLVSAIILKKKEPSL